MNTVTHLDVTALDTAQKDAAIFLKCLELQPGQSIVIHNNDDPMPVNNKLFKEPSKLFSYTYIEHGPAQWTVQVSRNEMDQPPGIGELAAKDYRKAKVFKKYGLNFCCGGSKTLIEACKEKNIPLAEVELELNATNLLPAVNLNYNDWDLRFVIDFIINNHHQYVRKSLRPLTELTAKVAKSHGRNNSNLISIADTFQEIADEMTIHMLKEEEIVFPYIRSLFQQQKLTDLRTVEGLVNILGKEHELAGKKMAVISVLSNRYEVPPGKCTSYSVLFQWLKEFEDDLHLHVHLENNILFPKAIKLEKDLA